MMELDSLIELAPRLSTRFLEKTAAMIPYARKVLQEPDACCATVLYLAVRTLFGVQVTAWEPETIWLTLERQENIELDELARDKIQAAITLVVNPSFYWDSYVFQRTAQALNGEPFDAYALQEIPPPVQCWAVYEAGIIRGLDLDVPVIPDYDEDVQSYTAVCLHRDGMVLPPDQLMYSRAALKNLYPKNTQEFAATVMKSWSQVKKEDLQKRKFPEDPLGVQLSYLAGCKLYVDERAEALAKDITLVSVRSSSPA